MARRHRELLVSTHATVTKTYDCNISSRFFIFKPGVYILNLIISELHLL